MLACNSKEISDLAGKLISAARDPASKVNCSEFSELLNAAMQTTGLSPHAVAVRFNASIAIVSRWRLGINIPHKAIRSVVLEWLLEHVQIVLGRT